MKGKMKDMKGDKGAKLKEKAKEMMMKKMDGKKEAPKKKK